ncbi:ABC transporter ATP-binding protein [Radiobacillus deserti]|uniref:ABC transporter ATP-binding protein n=1 Tax=Radiobacillus deserti TaxID=2594883 RepID=UPI0013151AE7|nr:ABC transporter ATP-binding protein [Radiobacillus deserti]
MKLLQFKNVTKNINENRVLTDITFEASSGQVIGLIGPNGAGKSTLLKVICNLLRPTSGEVLVNNVPLHKNFKDTSKKIGYLIEDPSLYPYLTTKEHLALCLQLQGNPINQHTINSITDALNITPFLNKKVKKLSMGMKQRVGIASAVIHNPEIVVLDEPTNSIDVKGINLVKQFILTLKKQGKLVIVSSHLLQEIQSICDQYLMIENGKLVNTEEINSPSTKSYRILVPYTTETNLFLKNYFSIKRTGNFLFFDISTESLNTTLNLLIKNNIHISDIEKLSLSLERFF